jgi:tetratricopeptide (TPR) repeat protein
MLRGLGRFDEALAQYKKVIAIDPAFPGTYRNIARMYLRWRGQFDEAAAWYRKALAIDPDPWWVFGILTPHDLRTGRYVEARARYEKRYPELLVEDEPRIDETNLEAAIVLAYVLAKTGEPERADLLLARALTFFQTIPRWTSWGTYRTSDVRIYALQGQTARALAALRVAIDAGWRQYWRYELEDAPMLDSIRDEPEFQAMVAEIRADMAVQLARLQEREANGELAPIPESLE